MSSSLSSLLATEPSYVLLFFFKSLSSPVLFVSQEQLDTETSTAQSETIQTAASLLASQVLSAKSKESVINVVKISVVFCIKMGTYGRLVTWPS